MSTGGHKALAAVHRKRGNCRRILTASREDPGTQQNMLRTVTFVERYRRYRDITAMKVFRVEYRSWLFL